MARIDHEAQKEPVCEEIEFLNLLAYWLFLRFVVNSSHPFGGLSIFIHSGQISPHVRVAFCSSWSNIVTPVSFCPFRPVGTEVECRLLSTLSHNVARNIHLISTLSALLRSMLSYRAVLRSTRTAPDLLAITTPFLLLVGVATCTTLPSVGTLIGHLCHSAIIACAYYSRRT